MPNSVGPNTIENGLVFAYDTNYYPHGWGLTQLFPDSEMQSSTPQFGIGSSFNNEHYLGSLYPQMTGNSLVFSGADLSNYYSSHPEWMGWDNGSIGSTGGNWLYSALLPNSPDTARDFIVDCKWRFKYISKTGNGSPNPIFQIGRAYTPLYQKSFYEVGGHYEWNHAKFRINGGDGNQNNHSTFAFGLTSADAAVEIDYMRVYEINKPEGLKDLTGNSTIDLSNVSFDSNAQMTFDGTDEILQLPKIITTQDFTVEQIIYEDSYNAEGWTFEQYNYGSGRLIVNSDPNNHLRFFIGGTAITANAPIPLGEYLHIVCKRSGNTGYIYYNGELVASGNISPNPIDDYTAAVGGSQVFSSGKQFIGSIPLTKVYNRPLSEDEIKTNFNAIKGRFNI